MIISSLAFEKIRKTGRLPQVAIQIDLLTRSIIFAQDGIQIIEQTLRKYDGSWQYDGSVQYGAEVVDIFHGVTSVSMLIEGDEGSPGSLEVQPARRSTVSATIPNPTGRLSDLVASDPLVGADGKLMTTFPGLVPALRVDRFKGEVSRITLTMDQMTIELRSG